MAGGAAGGDRAVNRRVCDTVNNGVYRAGFATTQEAYEEAVTALFETLDWLERRLSDRRYLMGDAPTEADVRLFTTLVRFDAVYHGHFKCNLRQITDYPAPWRFTREVHAWPGVAGRGRDGRLHPHRAALRPEPPDHQPEPDRAAVRARPLRVTVGLRPPVGGRKTGGAAGWTELRMFGKKTRQGAEAPAAPARPVQKTLRAASKGKQAYEARRAEKAGIGLERWLADKERRAQAERDAEHRARRKAAPEKKPGLLRRLLDRAHRPL